MAETSRRAANRRQGFQSVLRRGRNTMGEEIIAGKTAGLPRDDGGARLAQLPDRSARQLRNVRLRDHARRRRREMMRESRPDKNAPAKRLAADRRQGFRHSGDGVRCLGPMTLAEQLVSVDARFMRCRALRRDRGVDNVFW